MFKSLALAITVLSLAPPRASFGNITQTYDPRQMQLGMKVLF